MSNPVKDNVLYAKVDLEVHYDPECVQVPTAVPPGQGYRDSWQFPSRVAKGDIVGTYTGIENEVSYQVKFIFKYRYTINRFSKAYNIQKEYLWYVKKSEVTGFWDTGVDKIENPVLSEIETVVNKTDYTNYILGAALVGSLIFKKLKS